MRRTILLAFTAIAMLGASAQNKGFDTANLDTSIKPGDDFYQYAAGGWLRSHPLDDEHTDNGAFTDLYEKSQVDIQELILQYANTPQQKGTLGQKIGSLYNLMMDSVRLNREGWQPLRPTLEQIAAIKDRREYQLVTAQLDYKGADPKDKGSWGAFLAYRHIGAGAVIAPVYDGMCFSSTSQKGIEFGVSYTPIKNVLATFIYFNGKDIGVTDDRKAQQLYGCLDFFF